MAPRAVCPHRQSSYVTCHQPPLNISYASKNFPLRWLGCMWHVCMMAWLDRSRWCVHFMQGPHLQWICSLPPVTNLHSYSLMVLILHDFSLLLRPVNVCLLSLSLNTLFAHYKVRVKRWKGQLPLSHFSFNFMCECKIVLIAYVFMQLKFNCVYMSM